MVLRVCRNALPDPNDVQDAFQATFLVLVRRHGSLRGLDSVGGWLYGVACRVAARARVQTARRRIVEGRAAARVAEAVEPADAQAFDRDELGPIVQEQVRRLPEKYRCVVALCYWEGLTQEQAAAQLGIPIGTVRSRLARARDLLRRRLTGRGVEGLAIGTAAIRILPPLAPERIQTTVQAAARIAGGEAWRTVASSAVASLVQWMLWRTTMIKFSGIAAGAMLVGLAGVGVGLAAQRGGDAEARKPAAAIQQPAAIQQAPAPAGGGPPRAGEQDRPGEGRLIQSTLPGEAVIARLVPDGSLVKEGDFICELSSPAVDVQRFELGASILMASGELATARMNREVADIALREYKEGEFPTRLMEIDGDIALAKVELEFAEAEFREAKTRKPEDPAAVRRKERDRLRARLALEKAQRRREHLVKYTRDLKITELEAQCRIARGNERAKLAMYELELQKEKRLDASRTIVAPVGGKLHYRHGPGRSIELGAQVFFGQPIFTIHPPGS